MEENSPLKCETCGKECKNLLGLKSHLKTHIAPDASRETAKPEAKTVPSAETRMDAIEAKVDKLVDVLSSVVERLPQAGTPQPPPNAQVTTSPDADTTGLVPGKWRELADQHLGRDFGLRIENSDSGNFTMFVTVPKRYDRRGKNQPGDDISTGLVRRSSPEADVETWCKRIAENVKKSFPQFIPNAQ